MATLEQLSAALVKADAAGNSADAKAFADAIRQMRGPAMGEIPTDAAPQAPAKEPGIYEQYVRPFLEPAITTAGAVGGGLLGATAGTFSAGPVGTAAGGVAGASLGYGLGKEGMQLLDVAMGARQPRQGAAQVVEPVQNLLEGAAFEAGGRALGPAIGAVAGKIADIRRLPTQKAAEIARNALGPDLPEALNLLKASQSGGSAAQATADINSPTWQALLARVSKRDPRFTEALTASQGEVSLNALARLAGGSTAAEARGTVAAAKNALNAMTTPQREAALNRANLGKSVAEYEAQAGKLGSEAAAEVQSVRDLISAGNVAEAWARLDLIKRGLPVGAVKYTHFGELADKAFNEWSSKAANASLDLGQGARFSQGAADALRSVGIKPLKGDEVVRSIQGVANNPEFAGNDLITGAIGNLTKDIAQWTRGGGVIDAKALDAIRKNSVNAAIQQLRPGVDATTQRNLAASVMSEIRPALIDAIEAAGGTGYRQYLADYTKGMQRIAEKKLSGAALDLWKTNKDEFVRLVQNESPEAVEKILGPGRYNVASELADSTMSVLREQAAKHLKELKIKGQAEAGQDALKQLLLDSTSKIRLPSYVSAVVASTNKALNILENKIGAKTMAALTEASKTAGGAVKLLETLPANERNRVLKLISTPSQWTAAERAVAGTATVGGVNSLAPDRFNENALAQ